MAQFSLRRNPATDLAVFLHALRDAKPRRNHCFLRESCIADEPPVQPLRAAGRETLLHQTRAGLQQTASGLRTDQPRQDGGREPGRHGSVPERRQRNR